MSGLADADPLAVVLPYLTTYPSVTGFLPGDPGDHITDRNEPPYPHVRLTDPPGNDRTLNHLIAPLIQVEVLGDPDHSQGKPELRRLLYTILEALGRLPDRPTPPGEPVVTHVESSGGGGYVPEPTGQPRYISTVRIYLHP